jgi:hypothetical protein
VNTTFYIESKIIIDPFYGPNQSPVLTIPPIDRACPGVAFFHNPGAYDPDPGDSISFEMQIPFSDRRTQVLNYKDPNNTKFYTDYEHSNELASGPPTFSINNVTGTITWDAPGAQGEYNIAFHVVEWRKINGVWKRLGYVRRDMQILVEDCKNDRPVLELPKDTCVVAGEILNATIIGKDPNNDQVKIEAYSPIFNSPYNPPAKITPDPLKRGPNDPEYVAVPASTAFQWQTDCKYVRAQPYSVVFKITDNPPNGPHLATFETWFIRVVGPKPTWKPDYTKNNATRAVTVNWNPYACLNAETMQVWRKVGGSDFEPDHCETGMPDYLGYELVGTVPIKDANGPITTFTDTNNGKGLDVGAQYCYRLVAVFPAASGGESLVSEDLCIDPFLIVDPVITNVDVEETDEVNGSIIVKWLPPLENPNYAANYPFVYSIFRGTGFSGDSTSIQTGLTATTFTDTNLNTEGLVYNYTIHAYDQNGNFVGSSAQASSVRLETQSRLNRIELSWSAVVPWSNTIKQYKHIIYRGEDGATNKSDLTQIAEVDVASEGFTFTDEGLEEKKYCYLVETYGSYGNAKIPAPLINRSEIICAEPGDDVAPCKPLAPVLAEERNCEDYVHLIETCSNNTFSNKLTWTVDEADCNRDIAFYRIYYSNSATGEFTFLAEVRGTEYEDTKLQSSYARCYKIAAVDRSGNISEKSDAVCFDNCPYYELPNVFTPNGDGCNDKFSAYSQRDVVPSGEGETPPPTDCVTPNSAKEKCARFVQRVDFHVYNRWGKEVYSYVGDIDSEPGDGSQGDNIWIDWDGIGDDGQTLSTGVYYYIAEVTFLAIDPKKKYKTYKGWVHLMRGEN